MIHFSITHNCESIQFGVQYKLLTCLPRNHGITVWAWAQTVSKEYYRNALLRTFYKCILFKQLSRLLDVIPDSEKIYCIKRASGMSPFLLVPRSCSHLAERCGTGAKTAKML